MPPHPPSLLTRSIASATQAAIEVRECLQSEVGGNHNNCNTCWNRGPQTGQSEENSPNKKFVILGESPGEDELGHNPPTPFVGATGRFLQQEITAIDSNINIHSDCYLINSINCDVNHFFWGNDQKRKLALAINCRERVLEEIFSHDRTLVLAFGNINLWMHTKDTTNRILSYQNGWEAFTCPANSQRIPILHSIHPTRIMPIPGKNVNLLEQIRFRNDLQEAIGVYNGTRPYPPV